MEIGDDMTSGQDINPIEYEPRTLRADNHQGSQWDTSDCIDVGLRLAEALDHLHERGLAHRDVKPSNVIFVNGRAKLADIGLVAVRGQRTFVGTEGFVPPEGPGSAQADVYSLGKVLYEIATGKDRLAFPELPDEMPAGADRKRWLELNRIICDICEPRISKRKIATAANLADALRRLQRGKRRRLSGFAVWMTTLLLAGFVAWLSWEMVKDSEWVRRMNPAPPPVAPQTGMLRVVSAPEGAEVRDAKDQWIGTTNTGLIPATVGEPYFFTMKRSGYRPFTLQGTVPATVISEPLVLFASLENFSPPQPGEKWNDHLGNSYQPVDGKHVGTGLVTKALWLQFVEATSRSGKAVQFLRASKNGRTVEIALASVVEVAAFCEWFQDGAFKAGFLTEDDEVLPLFESAVEIPVSETARREGLKPFRIQVRPIDYGEITLTTDPSGVEVYINPTSDPTNRGSAGSTEGPLRIPKVKPGAWQLYLVREGYKPLTIDLDVKEGEKISQSVTLEKSKGAVFGKPWENGIGMRFAPLDQDLLVSVWETRIRDYQRFGNDSDRTVPHAAYFPQTPDHPVVNVSRDDAQAFCAWLTERERKDERIALTHVYRLPTDLEWSMMADLREEEGISPGWRDARKQRVFLWGTAWPPGGKVGNFADMAADGAGSVPSDRIIPGYDDGFAFTAPVGSYPANGYGLFDLSGNVQEWVEDDYSKLGRSVLGVLRGGCWISGQSENLLAGSRNAVPADFQDAIYGFRVVLAKLPPKPED
jgi:formylglycine-generating enzyme required for sulfatase activity